MDGLSSVQWLEPWYPVDIRSEFFELELYKEVAACHALYGKKVKAVARRCDRDDFLFELEGCPYKYALVHLTWNKETTPQYPHTVLYRDIEEWIHQRMEKDYQEYMPYEDYMKNILPFL